MAKKYLPFLISILVCLSIGSISSVFVIESVNSWYTTINKPFFNPPNTIFAPVWSFLYIVMGISVAIIWKKGYSSYEVKKAINIFISQLLLNGLWSILFFGLKNITLALLEIIILLLAILLTYKKFKPIDKWAAYLLVPYLLWVSFATVLTGAIWILN